MATGPMLSGEKMAEFQKALAGQESASEAAPASETAGDGGNTVTNDESSSSAANGTNGSASPEKDSPADAGNGQDEGTSQTPRGPIPYDRFREVNEERKQYLAKVQEYERKLGNVEATGKAEAVRILQDIAEKHPELRQAIYGYDETNAPSPNENGSPSATPSQANGNANPAAPSASAPNPLEREVRELKRWRQEYEQKQLLDDLEVRCEDQMSKHEVFKNEKLREIGERLIVQGLGANPKAPAEKIVDEVAGMIRSYEEEVKASYVKTKASAVKTVPPGTGTGSAAPPGAAQNRKLSLSDGSTLKALAAALKQTREE